MTVESKTPLFLLTGFLGSGKTTLLNAALRSPGLEHTAVVVNELGDIGLDNLIVAQATDNVVLLDAGCLCCANTGALHETLAELAGRRARGEIPPFRRVIIETSGAADPAPLLNVLLGHPLVTGSYVLEATVCDDRLTMSIADDGIGFDASVAERGKAGHFGCVGMRERARKIGAGVTWRSTSATGTTVELTLPLRTAPETPSAT